MEMAGECAAMGKARDFILTIYVCTIFFRRKNKEEKWDEKNVILYSILRFALL